jgi:hypothetical protein
MSKVEYQEWSMPESISVESMPFVASKVHVLSSSLVMLPYIVENLLANQLSHQISLLFESDGLVG